MSFDSSKDIEGIERLLKDITSRENMPLEIRLSIVRKAKRYLLALTGDVEAAIEVFIDSGLRPEDAKMEALVNLMERRPKGDFHAAKEVLVRYGKLF